MTELARFQIQITTEEATRNVDALNNSLGRVGAAAASGGDSISDLQARIAAAKVRADEFIAANQSLATRTTATGAATASTSINMAGLGRTMATAAGNAVGLDRNIVALAGSFGPFALGGAITLGIGAIAEELRRVKDAAADALNPFEGLREKYTRLRAEAEEEEFGPALEMAQLEQQTIITRNEVSRLETQLAALRAAGPGTGRDQGMRDNAISAVQRELGEFRRLQIEDDSNYLKAKLDTEKREREEAEKHAKEMERIERERIAKAKAALAEREALLKEEQRLLRMRREIYAEILDPETIEGPRGSQVRATTQQVVRGQQLLADDAEAMRQTKQINDSLQTRADIFRVLNPLQRHANQQLKEYQRGLLEQIDATERTRYAAVDLVAALGIVPGSVLNLADTLIRAKANMDAARASGKDGGLSGVDALSIATAGIGIIGQILQSRRQAELEAARLKAAQADFDRTLARFVDSIGPQSPLQRELAALADQFVALANQAAAAHNIQLTGDPSTYTAENIAERRLAIEKEISELGAREAARRLKDLLAEQSFLNKLEQSLKAIAEAEQAARARIEAERALAQRRVQDDIQVESLRLGGDPGAADRLALQQEQAQRFADALAQGFDQATLDMLNGLFDLQRAALAFREQTEAIQRAVDRDLLGLTTTGRELRLAGRDTDADQLALQIEAIQKLAEADKLRREGLIDEELHARLTALAHGELAQAMAALQKAAEEAAAATAAAVARQREDLEVRLLAARGQTDEADALQRRLRYQRELAETTDTGLQALITLIFQTEEQARVTERAAEAARGLQAALAAQARFMEDLRERELRATGRGEAADEFARMRRDAEEVRRALSDGFGANEVAELQRIQALERADADAERRRRQDEAFHRAQGGSVAEVPLSASPTAVSLAVGVTESTGTRLAGLMSSQLTYQAYLPRIHEELRQIRAQGRPSAGPSTGALEIALAQSAADAAADAGLIPGSQN